ncbi:unnamed protein product [Porites lobata]|uniref:DNA-directed DNA polymerase n=1 Tax=Porites lobata TaxID=104759 RepID=A0ABN8NWE7_9CNID|nr:unnamed protein product [Porites lobata]
MRGSSYIPLPGWIMLKKAIFLQTSLTNLVGNLQLTNDFHNTKAIFQENIELLTRKGVYPYDYVSSIEKLSETQLPPKSEFYSKLNDENISDSDYQHALNIWSTFNCKSICDYHDLYLKSDVLLLADVFKSFRKTCLHHFNLDPAHYYTSPGLAWDACLKETDTDSLLYLIHTDGFYKDISHDIKKKFDTSDYPEKHPSGIKTGVNKKV